MSSVIRKPARQWYVFSFSDPNVVIEIKDDGQGFNVPDQMDAFAPSGHYGLLGMSERADPGGGKLVIIINNRRRYPGQGRIQEIAFENYQEEVEEGDFQSLNSFK